MLTKKNILITIIINLFFYSVVFAIDDSIKIGNKLNTKNNYIAISQESNKNSNEEINQENLILDRNNNKSCHVVSNKGLLTISQNQEENRQILLDILDEEINNPDFNRINGNYIGIKLVILVLAIISSGSENLLLTNNKNITAEPIIATQIGVPICTENMYLVIDNFMLEIKNGIKSYIKQASQKKLKTLFIITKIAVSITLAYLAAIVETKTAGDGYRWLFSHVTSDDTSLDAAYYYGRYSRLLFSLNLYGVFFNQLINELLSKTGIGYLFKSYPPPTKNLNQLLMDSHVNNLLLMVSQEDIESTKNNISSYIKANNLNSSFNIADMQNILTNKVAKTNKKYNLFINLSKIVFIGATTVFCGISFKQIFSARLMLENFVDQIGKHTKGGIIFYFKNGSEVSCSNTVTCVNNLDFTSILITDKQISELLGSDDIAIMSSMLSGISIASCAAVIILTALDSAVKLSKNSRYKKALKTAYLEHNNLLPYLFCMVTIPPMYYGIKNIIDTRPVAEKYDLFLTSIGEDQLLTTNQAVIIAISCVGLTIAKYIPFVANFPRAIKYLIKKL
jgi:hypothetical protein